MIAMPVQMAFLFIDISWNHILDILLVAFLIYQLYNLTRGTVAIRIFIGIISIYLLWKLVVALQMEMLGEILGQFIGVGVIALLIVFQQELRKFLLLIGNTELFRGKAKQGFLAKLLNQETNSQAGIESILDATEKMASTLTGALMVIGRKSDPLLYCSSYEELDGLLSSRLIQSIFFKNSPLHDGAIVIQDNRITSVRAVLPVTENPKFPDHLGMRHRSAVGITESTDAIALIVSEQTGAISVAINGVLTTNLTIESLQKLLIKELTDEAKTEAQSAPAAS